MMLRLRKLVFAALTAAVFSAPLFAQNISDLQNRIKKQSVQLGISASDAQNAIISSTHTDAVTGIEYVYLQQGAQEVKVYNTILSLAYKNGQLVSRSGKFIADIAAKTGNASATYTVLPELAIVRAANHLKLDPNPAAIKLLANDYFTNKTMRFSDGGIAKEDIRLELLWVPNEAGTSIKLAWEVTIDVKGSPDYMQVRVDANNGDILGENNLTVYESHDHVNEMPPATLPANLPPYKQAGKTGLQQKQVVPNYFYAPPPNTENGSYYVVPFPYESPAAHALGLENNPWLKAGATNNATTHGWHFDGTNNYNHTRGNNVFSYTDVSNSNVNGGNNISDTSTTAAPILSFLRIPNFTQQPAVIENQKAAATNLFYWNNIIHDVTYQYGFTEAAGNFQQDNLGRGGLGADYVRAEAQDASGYNNANFATPADGSRPRMQMYLFSTAPDFRITSPAAIAGAYASAENSFTAPNKLINVGPVSGQAALYNDNAAGTVHTACSVPFNPGELSGKIVLIDATGGSGCTTFAAKAKRAQTAGAIGVIMYYPNLLAMGGTDNTLTIPVIITTTATANLIINQLSAGTPVTVTLATGIYRDGDYDNGVVTHEYGHGVSNRLTGGSATGACLGNAEQGGEGWSDYLGLMLTTDWATAQLTDGTKSRGTGAYATGSTFGFRRYPYSTNIAVNPLTYANVATSTEVHDIGEVWCIALWDMTWNIIQQQGSITPNLYNSQGTGGNVVAMNLVMTGMKLQPCTPGFLDARDAILRADTILYNGVHSCAIWAAFAKRGMGFSASQGLSTSATDQFAFNDLPYSIAFEKSVNPIVVNNGNQFSITSKVSCGCAVPVTGIVIRDTIPAGFTYVSSNGGTLSGNVVTFPPADFNTAQESKNFTITLQAAKTGCVIDSVLKDNRDGNTIGGLTSGAISGSTNWATSTARAASPNTSWFASNPATVTSFALTGNTFTAKELSVLSFNHFFNVENRFDGGVVELSTNNGSTWFDAAPYFIKNGYNTAMDASTSLANKKAFSGISTNGGFTNVLLNLSGFNTSSLKVRFRMTTDNGTGGEGWYLDDIILSNGCGGILKSALYNGSATEDTVSTPIFITTASLPLTLLSFEARQLNSQVLLNWQTTAELNTRSFVVEKSVDGLSWTTLGTVRAKNTAGVNNYQLTDENPVTGNNYYRVRMFDADGKFTLSPVRSVSFGGKTGQFTVVPNPASSYALLSFDKKLVSPEIVVTDASGKQVMRTKLSGSQSSYTLQTGALANGVYMIKIQSAMGELTAKLVINH